MEDKSYMLEADKINRIAGALQQIQSCLANDQNTRYDLLAEAAERREQADVLEKISENANRNNGAVLTADEIDTLAKFVESIGHKIQDSGASRSFRESKDKFNATLDEVGIGGGSAGFDGSRFGAQR